MHYLTIVVVAVAGIGLLTAASRKWSLPGGIASLLIAIATLAGAALAALLMRWDLPHVPIGVAALAAQVLAFVACLLLLFYRDPDRRVPDETGILVAPADGTVIYVRRLAPDEVLKSDKRGSILVLHELAGTDLASLELWQIGIAMVFTDVHVNRAPLSGRVVLLRHRPGKFYSLRRPDALNANERQILVIDGGRLQLAIVQIASRLVRRIEAFVDENQTLAIGQRIGIIKFGSQVDPFVPAAGLDALCVYCGDRLVAGVTIVGRLAQP